MYERESLEGDHIRAGENEPVANRWEAVLSAWYKRGVRT